MNNPFIMLAIGFWAVVVLVMFLVGFGVSKLIHNKTLKIVLIVLLEVAILLFVKFWFFRS